MMAARQCAKDMKEWRALVHIYMIEIHIDAWFLFSFKPLSRGLVAYHLDAVGCRYIMRLG